MDLIVNVTENWGIGLGNRLLVSIPEDLKRFRSLTLGKTVVLGRKTLETFPGGRPLKGRTNYVLSAQPGLKIEGAEVFADEEVLLRALALLPRDEICVIGGESVYRLLLPYCDRALVTRTEQVLPADRFFPDLDALPEWRQETLGELRTENGIPFRYIDYVNQNPREL